MRWNLGTKPQAKLDALAAALASKAEDAKKQANLSAQLEQQSAKHAAEKAATLRDVAAFKRACAGREEATKAGFEQRIVALRDEVVGARRAAEQHAARFAEALASLKRQAASGEEGWAKAREGMEATHAAALAAATKASEERLSRLAGEHMAAQDTLRTKASAREQALASEAGAEKEQALGKLRAEMAADAQAVRKIYGTLLCAQPPFLRYHSNPCGIDAVSSMRLSLGFAPTVRVCCCFCACNRQELLTTQREWEGRLAAQRTEAEAAAKAAALAAGQLREEMALAARQTVREGGGDWRRYLTTCMPGIQDSHSWRVLILHKWDAFGGITSRLGSHAKTTARIGARPRSEDHRESAGGGGGAGRGERATGQARVAPGVPRVWEPKRTGS